MTVKKEVPRVGLHTCWLVVSVVEERVDFKVYKRQPSPLKPSEFMYALQVPVCVDLWQDRTATVRLPKVMPAKPELRLAMAIKGLTEEEEVLQQLSSPGQIKNKEWYGKDLPNR